MIIVTFVKTSDLSTDDALLFAADQAPEMLGRLDPEYNGSESVGRRDPETLEDRKR